VEKESEDLVVKMKMSCKDALYIKNEGVKHY